MQLFILLFLPLLSRVTVVTAVAGCHSDRDKDDRPRKNCTAAGFSDVPAGLEPSTKVLLFPNNLFSSLTWSSFQIFPDLYEIDLRNNQVPQVTPTGSPVLPSLSVLWLGSNRLTSLSDGSFSACPALSELYLDNNAIDTLSNHTFAGLSKLEKLDLSSNRIKVLPELLLHPLSAIETLFLEKNEIKTMPDDWFSMKEMVPYLYLSANPWACSCSLDYLRRYLDDNEFNVYTRDGPLINNDVESVVCDSPEGLKGKSVSTLEESDLCSPATELGVMERGDFYQPAVTKTPDKTRTSTTGIPTTFTVSPPSTTTIPATTTIPTSHWSWSITRFTEWSEYTGSVGTSEAPLVEPHTLVLHPTLPHFKPSTESPVTTKTTEPAETDRSSPATLTSTNPQVYVLTATMTNPSWVVDKVGNGQHGQIAGVRGEGVFCFWLFAGFSILCLASALCISVTFVRMVIWYKMMNKSLSLSSARRGGRSEGVRLLTEDRREKREVAGGATEQFRSVLFVNRGGEAMVGNDEGERTRGGTERLLATLEPAGGEGVMGEGGGQRGRQEATRVYRKTLYRPISKEQEIEGWRDVMEECRVPAGDGGMDRERSGRGGSRKCYSIILREEREEAGGGREELDWVVGGWEVKRGGEEEEPRSSWGEWLAHYLPSMPWEVAVPPEGETAL